MPPGGHRRTGAADPPGRGPAHAPGPVGSNHVAGVRSIAVLRANRIGDFVVTLPALQALRAAYPSARLTVIGDDWLPGFLADRPGPWDRVVQAPSYPGLRGLDGDVPPGDDVVPFLAEHRALRYDLAIQMHGGGRTSNRFILGLGAGTSAGARTPDAAALDRWVPYVPHRNEVLRWLEVAALVGASPSGLADLQPSLTVTDRDLSESMTVQPGDAPFVALHVGSRDPARRWPARGFSGLARRLLRQGLEIVLVGSTADRDLCREVADDLDVGVTDLSGRLSLGGTLGLLSRAELFVGNDSGPRHLAMAANTATVGIFTPDNALHFGPVVGRHRVVLASTPATADTLEAVEEQALELLDEQKLNAPTGEGRPYR